MSSGRSDKEQAQKAPVAAEARAVQDAASAGKQAVNDASPPAEKTEAAVANKQAENPSADANPPLPDEEAPPLPDEPPPNAEDDGWEAKWDPAAGAWYFLNNRTGVSQWENPRVPAAPATVPSSESYGRNPHSSAATYTPSSGAPGTSSPPKRRWGGYNPAIHGSYDPNADYAREAEEEEEGEEQVDTATATAAAAAGMSTQDYMAEARFNRFTGKFQQSGVGPEMHNDENKSKRQMSAFFDVDAAANSHEGRSLKAERRGKVLSKKQLKAFKDKRHNKKEEKRRAWLLD